MYTYRFDRFAPTNKHTVLNPDGRVIYATRLKYAALQRVDIENNAISMRKAHELKQKTTLA